MILKIKLQSKDYFGNIYKICAKQVTVCDKKYNSIPFQRFCLCLAERFAFYF